METNPIYGRTIRWTYSDGPMSGTTFEHSFEPEGGGVRFARVENDAAGHVTRVASYRVAAIADGVHAVAYLGPSGFTLTSILNFRDNTLVSFSSNEREVAVHHGTFEVQERRPLAAVPSESRA